MPHTHTHTHTNESMGGGSAAEGVCVGSADSAGFVPKQTWDLIEREKPSSHLTLLFHVSCLQIIV